MKEIAVVILNWNGLHYLKKFLPSVIEFSPEADIWVVDNASTDGSMDFLRDQFPEVNILEHHTNMGFAKGYNEGLKKINNPFYVLLNSDVEVTPNWITPVLDYMKEHPKMAACQPKILDYNRKDYFEHAGAAGGYIDRDGYTFCAGRIMSAFEKDEGQYDKNEEVFWASGASLFIRSVNYHEVGGLDEDFFAHMEEIDLCWRLKNRGYSIGACRQSSVYHVGGGTLDKLNPFKTYLNFRNNLYLITKNYVQGPLGLKLFKRMILDGIAAVRFLTEGKLSYVWAVFKAHFSFYLNINKMLRKRKHIRSKSKEPNLKGRYTRSILLDFFIRKHTTFHSLDQDHFIR